MGYRKKTLQLLYVILEKNFQDGRIYSKASERCKRLFYKNFFRKLALEKRSFCKRIKYEIEVLENEVLSMGEETKVKFYYKESAAPILPAFRLEKDGLIRDCYRREKQNIGMCNQLLANISTGEVREMLLYQRHILRQILQEIESLGLKISDDYNDENTNEGKSEGEINLGEKQYG